MKLFDSHCHLDDPVFDPDRKAVVERARQAGVKAAMIVGISRETSIKAVELTNEYSCLYASVGIHPHEAQHCSSDVLDTLEVLANHSKVKAWGEIGLDFCRMHSPQEQQEHWFVQQLVRAQRLKLPLIFHERDSKGQFLNLLKTYYDDMRGGVHCFSGTKTEMMAYLDMGLYIGITGIATIKGRGKQLRDLIPLIPADRILIETDAPYLTPTPDRNKTRRNEPAFVKTTLLKIAAIRQEMPEKIASQTWDNTCRLFRIEALG
jgi:TatD DNase family protein